MDDTISRKAAIDLADAIIARDTSGENTVVEAMKAWKYGIEGLPSAQPEPRKGRWEMKPDPYGFFDEIPVCSECGHTTTMRRTYKFCPNCGAKMEGEYDESD